MRTLLAALVLASPAAIAAPGLVISVSASPHAAVSIIRRCTVAPLVCTDLVTLRHRAGFPPFGAANVGAAVALDLEEGRRREHGATLWRIFPGAPRILARGLVFRQPPLLAGGEVIAVRAEPLRALARERTRRGELLPRMSHVVAIDLDSGREREIHAFDGYDVRLLAARAGRILVQELDFQGDRVVAIEGGTIRELSRSQRHRWVIGSSDAESIFTVHDRGHVLPILAGNILVAGGRGITFGGTAVASPAGELYPLAATRNRAVIRAQGRDSQRFFVVRRAGPPIPIAAGWLDAFGVWE